MERKREHVLVSACLLGVCCRYDGGSNQMEGLQELMERCVLVPVCPEQLGGLSTPRAPAERQGSQVVTKDGRDVTRAYEKGAGEALKLYRLYGCSKALLKERSPSCGCGMIYDGSFQGRRVPGDGVTAKLLKSQGARIFGESQWRELADSLK